LISVGPIKNGKIVRMINFKGHRFESGNNGRELLLAQTEGRFLILRVLADYSILELGVLRFTFESAIV
jgi:hypothetical protein